MERQHWTTWAMNALGDFLRRGWLWARVHIFGWLGRLVLGLALRSMGLPAGVEGLLGIVLAALDGRTLARVAQERQRNTELWAEAERMAQRMGDWERQEPTKAAEGEEGAETEGENEEGGSTGGLPQRGRRARRKRSGSAKAMATKGEHVNEMQLRLHERLLAFLQESYEFRYNVLRDQAEYRQRSAEGKGAWLAMDKRAFNSITIEAVDAGIGVWGYDVRRVLNSLHLESFHPLRDYLANLPKWDGKDRVSELAERVCADELWVRGFGTWLRAMVAQWMGREGGVGNALVPLLVSQKQGLRKSSFCRGLMPKEIEAYFTDKFDVTTQGGMEMRMARLGLVNLDEFDRYTHRQMAMLKNVLQLRGLYCRQPYETVAQQQERMASFIGTSNELELLTDRTGSRRFLCVEIDREIDLSGLNHEQLYAQLVAEVAEGAALFLSKADELAWGARNRAFLVASPAEEVFGRVFSASTPEEGELLTATEIFVDLQGAFPAALRAMTAMGFGRVLRGMGIPMVRNSKGSCYWVKRKGALGAAPQ